MRMLNSHPLWSQAHKIFVPENNYGIEASHMQSLVKKYQDVTTYWEKDKPGVIKTHASTNAMQKEMVSCLYKNHLLFETDLFTCSQGMNPEKILSLCKEQFETYHWDLRPAKDAHSKNKWAMTGKMGNKQDDLYIVVAMAYMYGMEIMTKPTHDVFSKIPNEIIKRTANTIILN